MKHLLLTVACLLALPACERVKESMPITRTREVSTLAPAPNIDVASATRFFDDAPSGKENPMVWTTPAGWTEASATQMRLINMSFGPASEGECYLTAMEGDGGGIAANINRWRGQLGQPPLSEDEIGKLPKKQLMGAEGLMLTTDGDFKGMGDAADAKKDYRLVGILLPNPTLTIFVKMTGPKALVQQNMPAFDAFCQSINLRSKTQDVPTH